MVNRHSFTLRFDTNLYDTVDGFWNVRDSDHQRITHMTIGGFLNANEEDILQKAEQFSKITPPETIEFNHFGIFPGRRNSVLFLAPRITPELLDYHRTLHELMSEINCTPQDGYLPEDWVPHCSIDFRVKPNKMPRLLSDAMDYFDPHFPLKTRIKSMDVIRVVGPDVTFIHETFF